MIDQTIMAALAVSTVLLSQQPGQESAADDPQDSASTKTSGPQSPQWKAMSVKEKLEYDGRHMFDPPNLILAAFGAGFDQLRDHPSEWGEGWGPYFERYASHVGQYLIQRSIMFPVQAIDHEDTRYFSSPRRSYKGRVGDAFLHTIWRHSDRWRHSDSGGMMPAYSEFLGDYGAAAVSRLWWPQRFHNGTAVFIAGSDALLVDAGLNVFHEFTPDIKRWLHLGH